MSLIVTGSIGIDTIETPTGSASDVLGGSAPYFAAAASFFTDVQLVGAVGEDFPEHHLDTFKHFGVDLAGLERRSGSKTFRWSGKYHENMNERDTTAVELNVLAEDLPPVPEQYKDSEIVFLANTHPAGQQALLEQFPNRKLAIADTMDLWIENENAALKDLLRNLDGLVLNDQEAFQLTGKTNIVRAAEAVIQLGPKFVVIKKGEHGCLMAWRHPDEKTPTEIQTFVLPAYPTDAVVDPTGAGDTFASGMMGYLATQQSLSPATIKRALAFGTVTASYTIADFSLDGLRAATREDIDARYEKLKAAMSF